VFAMPDFDRNRIYDLRARLPLVRGTLAPLCSCMCAYTCVYIHAWVFVCNYACVFACMLTPLCVLVSLGWRSRPCLSCGADCPPPRRRPQRPSWRGCACTHPCQSSRASAAKPPASPATTFTQAYVQRVSVCVRASVGPSLCLCASHSLSLSAGACGRLWVVSCTFGEC
jgi:hypothetical protein